MKIEGKEGALISRREAANFLGGICLTTLARLSIPCVRIRRRVFYKREVLELWVSSQTEQLHCQW